MKPIPLTEEKLQRQPSGTVSVREVLTYMNQDRYMDLKDLADYLPLSERNIRSRLKEIPHFRVGNKLLFKKSEIDDWMQTQRVQNNELDEAMRVADSLFEE